MEEFLTLVIVILLAISQKQVCCFKCPAECECSIVENRRHQALCVKGGLTSIPQGFDVRTNILTIDAPKNGSNYIHGIPKATFRKYPNIEQLRITRSNLNGIAEYAFYGLSSCMVLDLSYNNISHISEKKLIGISLVTHLNLYSNNISEIASGQFTPLPQLRYLNMGRNGLHLLPARFFLELNNLETLVLNENPIKYLDEDVFLDVQHSLRKLHASNCSLTDIHEDTFKYMANLEYLNLNGNRLRPLKKGVFSKRLKMLKELYLDDNELTSIPDNLFEGLSLDVLSLSHNRLSEGMSPSSLEGLTTRSISLAYNGWDEIDSNILAPISGRLEEIDLSGNQLDVEKLDILLNTLSELVVLNLTNCSLSELPRSSIPYILRLSQLILSNNNLSTFDPRIVKDLSMYSCHIDLSGNSLTQLEIDLVDELKTVSVSLSNNPWHCNCVIRPLYEWIQELYPVNCTSDPKHITCLTCATPAEYAGVYVRNLNASHIETCPLVFRAKRLNMDARIGVAIAVMVIAVLLAILIALFWKRREITYYTHEEEFSDGQKTDHLWQEEVDANVPLDASLGKNQNPVVENEGRTKLIEKPNEGKKERPVSWATSV